MYVVEGKHLWEHVKHMQTSSWMCWSCCCCCCCWANKQQIK